LPPADCHYFRFHIRHYAAAAIIFADFSSFFASFFTLFSLALSFSAAIFSRFHFHYIAFAFRILSLLLIIIFIFHYAFFLDRQRPDFHMLSPCHADFLSPLRLFHFHITLTPMPRCRH
jgi:hypothetical protein